MHIQLNTDNQLTGSQDLARDVEPRVRTALGRFSDRITRVEVHLNDLNSDKAGSDDKRCMIEVRIAARQPIAVNHRAATLALAIDGAIGRMVSALDRVFGKAEPARRGRIAVDDSR